MRHWLRRRWWAPTLVLLAGTAIAVIVLWPATGGRDLPPTRARAYTDYNACLLTGPQGLADPAVGPIWAGMQDASTATHAKVSYLAAAGPDTLGNVQPYATTLAQRHCNTILATGATPIDALVHTAPAYPAIHFIVIGGPAGTGNNITTIATAPATQLQTAIATRLQDLSRQAPIS